MGDSSGRFNRRRPAGGLDAISTRWSLLRAARSASPTAAKSARDNLVRRYSGAIRGYVGAILKHAPDADELAQEVCVRILNGDFAGATPERGRFRHLLKTAIRNMAFNFLAARRRRSAADLDGADLPAPEEMNFPSDEQWAADWRRCLLEAAWEQFRRMHALGATGVLYTVLRLRSEHPADDSQALADRLSAAVGRPFRVDALRQQLRRARLVFARLLVDQVAKSLEEPSNERVEEELAELELLGYVREFLKLTSTRPPRADPPRS